MQNNSSTKIQEPLLVSLMLLMFFDYLGHGYLFVLLLIPILISKTKFTIWDRNAYATISFSLTYSAFYYLNDPNQTISWLITYSLVFITSYLLGKFIAQKNNVRTIFIIFFLCIFSFALLALMSVLREIYTNGFFGFSRNIPLIGRGDADYSATGFAIKFSLLIGMIALLLTPSGGKITKKNLVFILISFCITLVCTLRVGSRTALVITALVILIAFLYNWSVYNGRQKLLSLTSVTLLIVGVISIDLNDKFLFFFADRINDSASGTATAGGRTEMWYFFLEKIPDYPMGGIPGDNIHRFAHNLWIDTARVGGIIPCFFLLLLTFFYLTGAIKTLKNKKIPLYFRTLVVTVSIAFFAQFFVEPMLDAAALYVALFFTFWGMLVEINNKY